MSLTAADTTLAADGITIAATSPTNQNILVEGRLGTGSGDLTANAGANTIQLLNTSNDIGGTITLGPSTGSGGTVSLSNSSVTTRLGAVRATTITVNASRNLTLAGDINTTGTTTLNFGSAAGSTFSAPSGITLATGTLTINGGGNADTFNIGTNIPGTLNGNAGNDRFNITAPNITVSSIYGGNSTTDAGTDTLAGYNGTNDWQINSANGTLNGNLSFSGIENLAGGTGTDTFTVNDQISGLIDGGGAPVGSPDSVNLAGFSGNTTVRLLSAAPTGTVSNPAGTFTLYRIGSVTANTANNTLLGANTDSAWTINSANGGSVSYGGTSTIFGGFGNLTGGNGPDTFTFNAGGHVAGLIDGGGTNDALDIQALGTTTVDVYAAAPPNTILNAPGTLSVYGIESITANTGVANTLTLLQAQASYNWSLTSANGGTLSGGGLNTTTFSGFNTLNGGSGNDRLTATLTGAETGTVNFNGGGQAGDLVTLQGSGGYDGIYLAGAGVFTGGTSYDQLAYTAGANSYVLNLGGVAAITDNLTANSLTVNPGLATSAVTLVGSTLTANNANAPLTLANKSSLVLADIPDVTLDAANLPGTGLTLRNVSTLTNQTTGTTPAITAGGLILDGVAPAVSLTTRLGSLSILNGRGPVTIAEQDALTLGPIALGNNPFSLTAGGTVTGNAVLASSAAFTIDASGHDITLTGNNALSGPLAFTGNGVTLHNSVATRLASVTAGALTVTAGGDITQTGAITGPVVAGNPTAASATFTASGRNVTLNDAGNDFSSLTIAAGTVSVTDANRIDSGSITAGQVTLTTATGLGTPGTGGLPSPAFATQTAALTVNNASGGVYLTNSGAATVAVTTRGAIGLANHGSLTIDRLYTAGSEVDNRNQFHDIRLNVNGGSISGVPLAGLRTIYNTPDITATNLDVFVLSGGIGTEARRVSINVPETFGYYGLTNAYVHYYGDAPRTVTGTTDLINASTYDFLASIRLLEVESLGEFDPAIFTEVRNYYYEDVAILMPADQRIDATDEDEEKEEQARQRDVTPGCEGSARAAGTERVPGNACPDPKDRAEKSS